MSESIVNGAVMCGLGVVIVAECVFGEEEGTLNGE